MIFYIIYYNINTSKLKLKITKEWILDINDMNFDKKLTFADVKFKLPLRLKFKVNQTIQRFSGPEIGFTFGNSMDLTTLSILNVKRIY